MPKSTVVILVEIDTDETVAEGDPVTETVRDVVRSIAEAVRHRTVTAGVRVGRVDASLVGAVEPPQ